MGAGRSGRAQCGGVSNGIYPTDAAEQVQYLCEDSSTSILFVEDDEQLDKALEVRDQLPRLNKIVVFDMEGLRDLDDPHVMSLAALRELGRSYARANPGALTPARQPASPKTWRSWSTPRAPPANPKAPCTSTLAWSTPCGATTP